VKQFKTAGILAVILLVLGGLATWDEWQTKKDNEEEQTKNRFAELKAEDVIELDYFSKATTSDEDAAPADDPAKPEGQTEVGAVKKDGIWRLTKPVDVLADTQTIDGLIRTITEYSYAKVVATSRDQWSEYGLSEPARHVTLRTGGDSPKTLTVYFGNKAPIGYDVYLRTSEGDQVLLGSQHILMSTSKTLTDFRDKTLVKIEEPKLKTFTFEHKGDQAIEIAKTDGKYQIVKPEALDADGATVRDFVEDLSAVRVASFIDQPDEATKKAFASADYVIKWQQETGEDSTLKVLDKDGKLLAAFDPNQRVYVLPDDYKAKIGKDLNHFRNRRILEPDSLDAKSVDIDGEVYQNIEGNWYSQEDAAKFDDKGQYKGDPKDKPAERPYIRAFMVDLEFAKTDRFIPLDDPQAKALEVPEHRLTFQYHDATKPPLVIELFKAPGVDDKFLVKRSGGKYLYRIGKSTLNSMKPGKEAPPSPADEPETGLDDEGDGLNLDEHS
jgi:hypothetical protein